MDERYHTDPHEAMADSIGMMVAGYRAPALATRVTDETIGAMIKLAIKDALDGNGPFVQEANFGEGPEQVPTMAGIFREILESFGVDVSDQRVQEQWFAFGEKTLAEALAR